MAVIRSEKKPVTTTSALSPGSTRLAAATSMARVPLPARMNGWPDGPERQTSRIRSIDRPKASIRRGEVWPGGGADAAARTPGESSTGPGIMSKVAMGGMVAAGSIRREELRQSRPQDGELRLDDAPDHFVQDGVVAVDQDVPERDDAAVVRDLSGDLRIGFLELGERLPQDLELAFHGGAEHGVRGILLERATRGEAGDEIGGLPHVEQVLPGFKPHRGAFSTARSPAGSRGS